MKYISIQDKELITIGSFFIFIAMLLITSAMVITHYFVATHHVKYIYVYIFIFIIGIAYTFKFVYDVIEKYHHKIHKVENTLEATLARLEYAINGTGDGLWDWNLLTNEVYFSAKWKEMLGYKDDELLNALSTWENNVHPDDLQRTIKEIMHTHEKPGRAYCGIHRLRHKDGSWVWILDRGQTIFDADGTAIRMVGFHTDITTTKQQELRIKELSALLSNTINSFENLIYVKNNDFEYIECNEAFETFTGLSRKELLGKSDYDIFDKDIADSFRKNDEEVLDKGEAKRNSQWVSYPDGREIYLYSSNSLLHDAEGNVYGLVGNSFDMTTQKILEEQVKSQEDVMVAQSRHAAMGEMISMIAHQWRQPLSVISMDANSILVDIDLGTLNEKSLRKISNDIVSQTRELSKTIDDFKDFFKPDKIKEDTFIINVVEDALNVIGTALSNNNINVMLDIPPEIQIKTYARELMQVVINIINNAKEVILEQENPERKIQINVSQINQTINIKISDNGGGIDPNIMGKIYEPYFTTKGEKNGTGLGLYMSKTIIEKHLKGSINAYNVDDGACFEIKLQKNI